MPHAIRLMMCSPSASCRPRAIAPLWPVVPGEICDGLIGSTARSLTVRLQVGKGGHRTERGKVPSAPNHQDRGVTPSSYSVLTKDKVLPHMDQRHEHCAISARDQIDRSPAVEPSQSVTVNRELD